MRATTLSAMILLIGCGNGQTSPGDTTPSGDWWNSGSDPGSNDDDNPDSDDDEDEDEDDDEDEGEDDEGEDDEEGEEVGQFFWGELSTSEGLGAVGFFSVSASGVDCEEEFIASSIAPISDCSQCSSAYSMTLGQRELFSDDESGCAASPYGDLSGTVFRFGLSGETLYIDSGSGFEVVPGGFAESEGNDVFFEIGSGEAPEDEEDEEE
ncbi:MAG: hypothetical protein AAFV53_08440 [Myxococcota bacterium]